MTRQEQVAELLGKGLTPKDIADRLGIDRSTVYVHTYNIRRSLGLLNPEHNQARALQLAAQGMKPSRIAEHLGCSSWAAAQILKTATMSNRRSRSYRSPRQESETPEQAARRVAADLEAGRRCRRCHSPIGGLCTSERCELLANPPLRRHVEHAV